MRSASLASSVSLVALVLCATAVGALSLSKTDYGEDSSLSEAPPTTSRATLSKGSRGFSLAQHQVNEKDEICAI
jgi:hypothetical protein